MKPDRIKPTNVNSSHKHETDFDNSQLAPALFYHTTLRNNLENILSKQTRLRKQGPLERLFSEKTKTLKATVKALLDEIELRQTLHSHILATIDNTISDQRSRLMHLEGMNTHYWLDVFKEMNKMKNHLENKALELEKEKRQEHLECWRDLMFLKKYLMSALREYWDLTQKRNILSYDLSELTKNENTRGR